METYEMKPKSAFYPEEKPVKSDEKKLEHEYWKVSSRRKESGNGKVKKGKIYFDFFNDEVKIFWRFHEKLRRLLLIESDR